MSQSIDLSAVTESTFNGTVVEQINLNGAGVWTKPVSGMQMQLRQPQPPAYAGERPTYDSSTPWATVHDDAIVYDSFGLSYTCGFVNHGGKLYIGWGSPTINTGTPDPLPALLSSAGMSFPFALTFPADLQAVNHGEYRNRSDGRTWYPIAEITPTGFVKAYTGPNAVSVSAWAYTDQYGNSNNIYFDINFSTSIVDGKCYHCMPFGAVTHADCQAKAYNDKLHHTGSGLYWSHRTIQSNTALANMPTNFNNNFEAIGSGTATTMRFV